MNAREAEDWLAELVPRETFHRLAALVELVLAAGSSQNLVSQSTLGEIWSRHIADSAQLASLLAEGEALDIGSGAGFPGLVVAIMRSAPITLAEPRRLRAQFLSAAAAALSLGNVTVRQLRVEALAASPFASIVARAVTSLSSLFTMAEHVASLETCWVLPKGRSAQTELAAARETWHGDFRLVDSVTDPEAAIIVATGIRRRGRRGGKR